MTCFLTRTCQKTKQMHVGEAPSDSQNQEGRMSRVVFLLWFLCRSVKTAQEHPDRRAEIQENNKVGDYNTIFAFRFSPFAFILSAERPL